MSEFIQNNLSREERLNLMRNLLIDMDKGLISPQEVKERFKKILENVHPAEIAIIENTLIVQDHFPQEKIHKLCDVHIDIFRESLENEEIKVQPGHPLYILYDEHKKISFVLGKVMSIASKIESLNNKEEVIKVLLENFEVFDALLDLENHMVREENALFPFLERHDVVQPPQILWNEHDSVRARLKDLKKYLEKASNLEEADLKEIPNLLKYIVDLKTSHIYKENKILFPTAIDRLNEEEWNKVLESMSEIGYAKFTDRNLIPEVIESQDRYGKQEDRYVYLGSGKFTLDELNAFFEALPFEVTFINKDDIVQFFNRGEKRIFVRTKSVLGRSVQNCHPPKSVHIVNKILEDFKSGKRDLAEFWINLQGRLIYIRYFAVRDTNGNYLGTLEVTQDVTDIKKLEGEKRIYSEE
ncbi:DUF438 domain-containing protein [Caldisericum exile]|uniref:Signaling protein n=1 Tax=Caldisericum exile (strain DSM 21853 / NBRC 104410 / AZM16c01) TaxID=511051 RepID=A0A7U6JG52_CALEA|nr:DUF438 domain-containing protein [Caldisericum exile]BAL81020.1 putative signaling protein [Caldisericum exile AZM16c01]